MKPQKRRILVFSPDPDLAFSLALALRTENNVNHVTRLETLRGRIISCSPDLMLIDLFAYQGEIAKLLVVLQSLASRPPIVFLRGYRHWLPEIEALVEEKAAMMFYKPVDMRLVADSVQQLLNGIPRHEQMSLEIIKTSEAYLL